MVVRPLYQALEDVLKEHKINIDGIKGNKQDISVSSVDVLDDIPLGSYSVIASRPAMGKTAVLIAKLVDLASISKDPIYFIDVADKEVDDNVLFRIFAVLCNLDSTKFYHFSFDSKDIVKMVSCIEKVKTWNVMYVSSIHDSASLKQFMEEKLHDCVVLVDNMECLDTVLHHNRKFNYSYYSIQTQKEMNLFSSFLKDVSRRNHLGILASVHLRRGLERRKDRHPVLSDLFSIADDSDRVYLLYRDDYYKEAVYDENSVSDLEIHKAKDMDGIEETKVVKLSHLTSGLTENRSERK